MKGSINILISTKRLRYELELRRNITIIQGDSASGKTTMIQIISDYLAGKAGPGTKVVCDRKCVVLSGDDESALAKLGMQKNSVVFVDEQERFLYSKPFAKAVCFRASCKWSCRVLALLQLIFYLASCLLCSAWHSSLLSKG